MIGVSLSHSVRGRVIYSTVLVLFVHVEPYQHFVKQEAGPATIVRRHAPPGPCSHLMRGHELDGVLLLALLQSHRRSQEGFLRYCSIVPSVVVHLICLMF